MSRMPLIPLAVLALLVAACSAGASATATPPVSATPIASGTPSPPPSPSAALSVPASASPEPLPSVEPTVPNELGADFAGLAFVRAASPDGSGASQVFVVGPDGVARQITLYDDAHDFGGAVWVRWSPDGSRLAVSIGYQGAARTDVMDADGGNVVELGGGKQVEWSPDGTRLVLTDPFDVALPGFTPAVRVLDPAAGTDVQVGQGFLPHWDDNETVSAFQAVGETATDPGEPTIFLFPADGSGGQAVLTTGQREAIWSPDHTRLAEVGLNGDCSAGCSHVVLSGEGVADTINDAFHPVWSPDSSTVAYLTGGSPMNIGIYDPASGERTLAAMATDMAWSPDGRRLALEAENGVIRAVVVIDAVNEDQLLVTLGSSPSWRASG